VGCGDFKAIGLQRAFEGQDLNAEPKYDDEGYLADGNNDCEAIEHGNEEAGVPNKEQKYKVDNREY
jgi:hypothetical protein